MIDEGLKVRFVGDASSLETASKQSTAALDNVTKSTAKVSQALAQSSAKMAQGAAAMGGSITKGANQANLAMVNLGRVLQDAPYGFIGIANNLNPLLESFQRLKTETGSTGGAIKSLASSLIGGGGIGIALSAITAAVQFAQLGFSMWSRGMNKAADEEDELSKKTEETQKRIKELTKSLSEVKVDIRAQAVGDTEGEIAKVKALAAVIEDQTKSYNQRNNALKELQGINKNYFGDLTLESNSLKDLTARVDEYGQAIISAAIVKEFSSDIAKVSKEIVLQRGEVGKGVKSIYDLSTALKLAKERNTDLKSRELGYTTPEIAAAQNRFGKAVALLKDQNESLSKLGEQKVILTKAFNDALQESLKFKPLTTTDKPEKKSLKDANKELENSLKERRKIIEDFLEQNGENFKIPVAKFDFDIKGNLNNAQLKESLQNQLNRLQFLNLEIKVPTTVTGIDIKNIPIPLKPTVEWTDTDLHKQLVSIGDIGKRIGDTLGGSFGDTFKGIFEKQFSDAVANGLNGKQLEDFKTELAAIGTVGALAAEGIADAFGKFGEELLQGKASMNSFAGALTAAFRSIGREIIKDIALAAILSAIKAATGQGEAGFFKNFLSVISGSHASGLYRVPKNGYIAELHKDEMVVPAKFANIFRGFTTPTFSQLSFQSMGSVSTPTAKQIDRTSGFIGGSVVDVNVNGQFVQRGKDMVATINQTAKSIRRAT